MNCFNSFIFHSKLPLSNLSGFGCEMKVSLSSLFTYFSSCPHPICWLALPFLASATCVRSSIALHLQRQSCSAVQLQGAPFTWFSISGFAAWTPTPQQRVSFPAVQVLNFLLIRAAKHQTGSWQDQGRRWLGARQVEESSAGLCHAARRILCGE